MKKDMIEIGKTYCNKTGKSAREVLNIVTVDRDMKWDGLLVGHEDKSGVGAEKVTLPHWVYEGETAVIYRQARGQCTGKASALALGSFAAWANRIDDGAPESKAERLEGQVTWACTLLEDAKAHLSDDMLIERIDRFLKEARNA
jgi:hypothetical protein